jgi:hypothetical protein
MLPLLLLVLAANPAPPAPQQYSTELIVNLYQDYSNYWVDVSLNRDRSDEYQTGVKYPFTLINNYAMVTSPRHFQL